MLFNSVFCCNITVYRKIFRGQLQGCSPPVRELLPMTDPEPESIFVYSSHRLVIILCTNMFRRWETAGCGVEPRQLSESCSADDSWFTRTRFIVGHVENRIHMQRSHICTPSGPDRHLSVQVEWNEGWHTLVKHCTLFTLHPYPG